jgi:ketosteroid isomerase-like protein
MHEYEALVRGLDEYARTKQYDRIRDVVTDEVVAWSPTYDLKSADELVAAIKTQNDNAENISTELTVHVSGDRVFWESVWRGDYPALGKSIELRGLSVAEVRDGKLANIRQYWDNLAVMTALGLIPSQG